MGQVLCTTETLTGETELQKGLFGDQVWVHVIRHAWDTNTGCDEPDREAWRKMKPSDVEKLRQIQEKKQATLIAKGQEKMMEELRENAAGYHAGEVVWDVPQGDMAMGGAELYQLSVAGETGEITVTRSFTMGSNVATSVDVRGHIENLEEAECDTGDLLEAFKESADGHLKIVWSYEGIDRMCYVAQRAQVGEEETLIAGFAARDPEKGVYAEIEHEIPVSELEKSTAMTM